MLFDDRIQSYIFYCKDQIQALDYELLSYPEWTLHCYKNGKSYMTRLSRPGNPQVYLKKSERRMAERLARKARIEAQLKDLQAELEICEKFAESIEQLPHAVDHLMSNPGMRDLLNVKDTHSDSYVQEWMDEPYIKYTGYPDGKTLNTLTGEMVRSKSEALCLNTLYNLHIPFRYEQEWTFSGRPYHPDFTVMRPRDHKIFIIELFGMMGEPTYIANTCQKLETYALNGWVEGHNLICIYESETMPIDSLHMEKTFRYFLLGEA